MEMGVSNGSAPDLQSDSTLLRDAGKSTEAKADRSA
jgi:hypothetical protein